MLILISKLILGFFIFQLVYISYGLSIIGKEYLLLKLGYFNWRINRTSKEKKYQVLKKAILKDIKNKVFFNEMDSLVLSEKTYFNDDKMYEFVYSLNLSDFEFLVCYNKPIEYYYKYWLYQKYYTLSDEDVYWGELEKTDVSLLMLKEIKRNPHLQTFLQSQQFNTFLINGSHN